MTEQEQLIQEIREWLGNMPRTRMIESLMTATHLGQSYSIPVDEIQKIIIQEANTAGFQVST
jgi:hypothetical protein